MRSVLLALAVFLLPLEALAQVEALGSPARSYPEAPSHASEMRARAAIAAARQACEREAGRANGQLGAGIAVGLLGGGMMIGGGLGMFLTLFIEGSGGCPPSGCFDIAAIVGFAVMAASGIAGLVGGIVLGAGSHARRRRAQERLDDVMFELELRANGLALTF